jgi:DNA-binding protein Fis
MFGEKIKAEVGSLTVATTNNRGFPVEYWVDRCLDKIVYVADDSDSVIKDQAVAFKDDIRKVLHHYIANAVKSDRTTLYNLLLQQGETKMAEILRRL